MYNSIKNETKWLPEPNLAEPPRLLVERRREPLQFLDQDFDLNDQDNEENAHYMTWYDTATCQGICRRSLDASKVSWFRKRYQHMGRVQASQIRPI